MSKLVGAATAALALVAPVAHAHAAVPGSDAAACAADSGRPAILVKVIGLKSRTGIVRIQAYDDPARFFDKGAYIRRIDIPMPGKVDVCVPVARPGVYAISVRHDVSGDGRAGLSDGAGLSGNPDVSLADALMKRKPPASAVAVRVGMAVATVPVVMKYVSGFSLKPIRAVTGS